MNERMPQRRQREGVSEDSGEVDTHVRIGETQKSIQKMSTDVLHQKLVAIDPEESTIVRNIHLGDVHSAAEHTTMRKFENAQRINEELGREITIEEIIKNVPDDFDVSVFSEKTHAYLKNAYPNTQYWDPRLITALDECGIYMDPERTIKPRILVTQMVNGEKRYARLDISEAIQILKAYASKSKQ